MVSCDARLAAGTRRAMGRCVLDVGRGSLARGLLTLRDTSRLRVHPWPPTLPSHQLNMTVLMTPDTANFAGNVHGGTILKLLDQVAYACASRYAALYVVTLSVDQVTFRQPIHVGELVTFLASVNYTGTSSMEVGIKVVAQNIRSQVARHAKQLLFHDGGRGRAAQSGRCPSARAIERG